MEWLIIKKIDYPHDQKDSPAMNRSAYRVARLVPQRCVDAPAFEPFLFQDLPAADRRADEGH
jgi:hypothetical protein